MQITYVPMLAQIATSFFHLGFIYLFVTVYGFDVEGLGYANCASGLVNLLFTVVYTLFVPSIREAV